MKKSIILIAALTISLAMGACSDSNKENEEGPYVNPSDASAWYFRGKMDIAGQDDGSTFTLNNHVMKVVFDNDRKTCNLVMYKANFAEAMRVELDIVVNGLTATANSTGYNLRGDDIIPLWYNPQSGQLTPMPQYTMKDIRIDVTGPIC